MDDQTEKKQKNIILYTAAWCGFCRSEKQYLESKNISYIAKDIEEDEAAYHELMEKLGGRENFRGIPVTDIEGEIILGFDRPKINQVLGIA